MNGSTLSQIESTLSAQEAVARLKTRISTAGLTLFAHVNHSEAAHKAGLELPETHVLLFGNPLAGTPLMQRYPDIAIALPLRILVQEGARGGSVLSYEPSRALAERFGIDPATEPIFGKLQEGLERLVKDLNSGL